MLEGDGVPLSGLRNPNYLTKYLSVSDLTDLHLARERFPFHFSPEIGITLWDSPLVVLSGNEAYQQLYDRIRQRLETLALRKRDLTVEETPVYTLKPVEETFWIASVQMICPDADNLSHGLVADNTGFFDALIDNSLHALSFEQVCKSNLFTYYLDSL